MRYGSRDLGTVFSPIDVVARWVGVSARPLIDLDLDWQGSIDEVGFVIAVLENKIKTIDDIADFAFNEADFALGHHAFRVPLLLQMAGRNEEMRAYVARVQETGFIPNYDEFLAEAM